ncbi:MAG: PDZ domain-containing protein [Terracidiphilus sp.]
MPAIPKIAARNVFAFIAAVCAISAALAAHASSGPHIFQRPAIGKDMIAFGYADDLWVVPRTGGHATRLTTGVGIEEAPIFSPDGQTIAFTGQYDGNFDVYTIPVTGGIPFRVTYHPAADYAVGWSPDGKDILFHSNRQAASRYTQLYTIPVQGGFAKALPLPMAFEGQFSPDGKEIAYSPLSLAFGFNYDFYVAWGNYHGGTASTIWITTLPGLDSTEIPHENSSDFDPVYVDGNIYFLSGRDGPITIFKYDPATRTVTKAFDNKGTDIHTLDGNGGTLVYDQLGEIHTFDTATGKDSIVPIDVDADLPEVRPRIQSVGDEVQNVTISATGVRVAVEAHGEILTVATKKGPTRNITNTPGLEERTPAWSPDGQSIAYFSDESGLYTLDVAPQTGDAVAGAAPLKKFPISTDASYYFNPKWSPDSKLIVFNDNRLKVWMLDTTTGKVTLICDQNEYGGFSNVSFDFAWSPDSKWLAYERSLANHLHAIYLYSVDSGKSTEITDEMADSDNPAFDRDGKYLYFTTSTNGGATSDGLDMTADLYIETSKVYAAVLQADGASPLAPELGDEKPAEKKDEKKDDKKDTAAAGSPDKKPDQKESGDESAAKSKEPKPVKIDLDGIQSRIVAMPMPEGIYLALATGLKGSLYYLWAPPERDSERISTLSRWTPEERKTEKLADRVRSFELSADGNNMLLAIAPPHNDDGGGGPPSWVVVPADQPVKPGEGGLNFGGLKVRVDPKAEWEQMYHEVWRIERAYFYNPHFNGTDTEAQEKKFEPWVASIAARADLNYIFQEMLGAFSVGHLRGFGGRIPEAEHVAGGLLGADYEIENNRYCFAKIYTGEDFNPQIKAPLAQPGLNVKIGDCILAINGADLTADTNIQQPLDGTAGQVISLRIASADGKNPRDISVIPVGSEYTLRNVDWIEGNRRKVDKLSNGQLAYVYLPDTGGGGFTNFNRYYFAQTDKKGAIIDERFNGGGQVADYFIEVMKRQIESYWQPRYGSIEHTPNAGIYGPKVMLANEQSGSGGDALPWLFKEAKLGPLVGKRTWGGLVGIGPIPTLMDGGRVTSPSVAFFSPKGQWDVENHGVDPDYVVEQDPKLVSEGHDPQLEKAVSLALDELKAHPPAPTPEHPAYPDYHGVY